MSNKTMSITEINKSSNEFKDTHTLQVGGFEDGGGRLTAADVQKELRISIAGVQKELRTSIADVQKELRTNIASVQKELRTSIATVQKELRGSVALILEEMRKGFKQINDRIDNLVTKNNLKE